MEKELNNLQTQLINDINHTRSIVATIKDLASYINLEPVFYRDLELTSSTLQDLSQRVTQTVDLTRLEYFLLAAKQMKMMGEDLLDDCKKNMYSA